MKQLCVVLSNKMKQLCVVLSNEMKQLNKTIAPVKAGEKKLNK